MLVVQAFFRRSLRNKMEFKCVSSNDCVIKAGKRNACSACRLKKCIDVGMSTAGLLKLVNVYSTQSLGGCNIVAQLNTVHYSDCVTCSLSN